VRRAVQTLIEVKLRRQEQEDEERSMRGRIILRGVCPDCAGDLRRIERIRGWLTDSARFDCVQCGRRHRYNYPAV